jgi:lipase maturation factor 1
MKPPPRGTLVFDGACGFCRLWVARWMDAAGPGVVAVPFQEAAFAGLDRAECERAVQWVGEDGARASGAEAAFLVLASGSAFWRAVLGLCRALPPVAVLCDTAYGLVARNRGFFSFCTRLLWGDTVRRPAFSLASWLFARVLGLVFLVAFVSYWVQAAGLVGESGILPAGEFFGMVREGGGDFRDAPGLFWWGAGDMALAVWCGVGVVVSLGLVAGLLPAVCLLVATVCYLSLCVAGQEFFAFQWDSLLIETGFLSIFFVPWVLWSGRPSDPPRAARFLLLWLLFRLMISSGLSKFSAGDVAWQPDLTALGLHLFTQPLPTPLAWFAAQLPPEILRAGTAGVLFAECLLPIFLFAPRRPRHLAAAGLVVLQVLVLLTGNFGFFNLLAIALCLPAFDDCFLRGVFRLPGRAPVPRAHAPAWLLAPLVAAVVLLSLVPFSVALRKPLPWMDPLRAAYDHVHPFRILNSYGLFSTITKTRREIIVQGTEDGFTWHAYGFRFKPGDVMRPPPVVAPHMPRLDWQMWFAALGSPAMNPWFASFCERLLLAEPGVLALLEHDPFDGRRPRFVRAYVDGYRFTSAAQRAETGAWWTAEPLGIYLPEVALDPLHRGSEAP